MLKNWNILLPLSSLFVGCTTIDEQNRVDGWPELAIVERKVSFYEVQERCKPFVGWGMWPMACASFLFHRNECLIYYAFDWSLEHERMHCLGYDHEGSDLMRRYLADWRARDLAR